MCDTWRGEETSRLNRTYDILSRDCTRMNVTWIHRSLDLHLTPVLHRDRGLIGRSRSSIYVRSIGRCRRIVEEPHDRSPIEPRSWRDRAAIMELLSRNHSHRIRRRPTKLQDHDRLTIVARSWPDCGLFLKQSQSNSPLIPGQSVATLKPRSMPMESHPRRCKFALTTAPSPTISSPISSLKPMYFSLCS